MVGGPTRAAGRGELGKVRSCSEELGSGRYEELLDRLLHLVEAGGTSPPVYDVPREERAKDQGPSGEHRSEVVREAEVARAARDRGREEGDAAARASVRRIEEGVGVLGRQDTETGDAPGPLEQVSGAHGPAVEVSDPHTRWENVYPSPAGGSPGYVPGQHPEHLLRQLEYTRNPREIARLATEVVRWYNPEFTRSLVLGTPLSGTWKVPAWMALILFFQPLLTVLLVLILR